MAHICQCLADYFLSRAQLEIVEEQLDLARQVKGNRIVGTTMSCGACGCPAAWA